MSLVNVDKELFFGMTIVFNPLGDEDVTVYEEKRFDNVTRITCKKAIKELKLLTDEFIMALILHPEDMGDSGADIYILGPDADAGLIELHEFLLLVPELYGPDPVIASMKCSWLSLV